MYGCALVGQIVAVEGAEIVNKDINPDDKRETFENKLYEGLRAEGIVPKYDVRQHIYMKNGKVTCMNPLGCTFNYKCEASSDNKTTLLNPVGSIFIQGNKFCQGYKPDDNSMGNITFHSGSVYIAGKEFGCKGFVGNKADTAPTIPLAATAIFAAAALLASSFI